MQQSARSIVVIPSVWKSSRRFMTQNFRLASQKQHEDILNPYSTRKLHLRGALTPYTKPYVNCTIIYWAPMTYRLVRFLVGNQTSTASFFCRWWTSSLIHLLTASRQNESRFCHCTLSARRCHCDNQHCAVQRPKGRLPHYKRITNREHYSCTSLLIISRRCGMLMRRPITSRRYRHWEKCSATWESIYDGRALQCDIRYRNSSSTLCKKRIRVDFTCWRGIKRKVAKNCNCVPP